MESSQELLALFPKYECSYSTNWIHELLMSLKFDFKIIRQSC